MKQLYTLIFLLFAFKGFGATRYWDGSSGDGQWSTAANWVGNVVPLAADDVVLDNLNGVPGTYTVTLPATAVTVNSLTISPSGSNIITLILPATNVNSPGFQTTGSIFIHSGGVLKNASASTTVPTITVGATASDSLYIYNGGTYEHNTARSITTVLDKVSTAPGTEYGLVHYNQPLTGSTNIALQGRTFGSVEFSAGSAPSALTYTSTGTTTAAPVVIRGHFKVNSPATFNSSIIAGFTFAGNFTANGNFTYNPSSSANPGSRSLFFNGNGTTQLISGTGTITLGSNFAKMEISAGAVANLQRSITAFGSGDSIVVKPNAGLILTAENSVSGTGSIFYNDTLSTLSIGSASGITASGAAGNVQTDTRTFSKKAAYGYIGTTAQNSGSGLPDSINRLFVQNPADVTLSGPVTVLQQLALDSGRLITTTASRIKLAAGGIVTSPFVNIYGSSNQGSQDGFVSGPMTMETSSTDTLTFPVGKKIGSTLLYAPVKLKPSTSTMKEYTAEYFAAQHSDALNVAPILDHISRVEYWDISCNLTSTPANEAKVSLSWRPASYVGTGNPADSLVAMQDLVVAHYFNDGFSTRWNVDGFAPTFTVRPNSTLSYGFITTDLFTGSFSPFSLGTKSAFNLLPVKLLSFAGRAQQQGIQLQWSTRQEQDISRYELQKSNANGEFITLGTIPSLNRLSTFSYGFLDVEASPGWNYYRLKVIDNQQHSFLTHTIKVWMGGAGNVLVYPSLASSQLKIVLPARSNSGITIVNNAGQVVKRVSTAESLLTINIESLSKGMYTVYIQTNGQAIVQRFIKQ